MFNPILLRFKAKIMPQIKGKRQGMQRWHLPEENMVNLVQETLILRFPLINEW